MSTVSPAAAARHRMVSVAPRLNRSSSAGCLTRMPWRVKGSDVEENPTNGNLMVTVENTPMIADVGFGGGGLLHPIPLAETLPVRHYAWEYRLIREGSAWVLQSLTEAQWLDLYTFTLDRQYRIDYEVANYYVSTHPDAQFTQGLFVQQATPEARCFLHADTLTIDRGPGKETVRTLTDNDARLAVLAGTFDLHFPPGTTFDHVPKPITTKKENPA